MRVRPVIEDPEPCICHTSPGVCAVIDVVSLVEHVSAEHGATSMRYAVPDARSVKSIAGAVTTRELRNEPPASLHETSYRGTVPLSGADQDTRKRVDEKYSVPATVADEMRLATTERGAFGRESVAA